MAQNGYRGLFEPYPDIPHQRLRLRLGRFTQVTEGMLKDLKRGNPIELRFADKQQRDQAARSLRPLGKLSPVG